jgi:rod shape-determining protein MreC
MSRPSSKALLALTLTLIAVSLLILSLSGYLEPAQSLLLRPLSVAQRWIAARVAAISDFLTSPRDIATLRNRIAELEGENAHLEQEIIILREQLSETEILSALLDYARTQPESSYLAADVIGQDISPFLQWVLIGAGSDDGIRHGMPVVSAEGLVGRVSDVYATVSRVQLITDPALAVNVKMQSTGADGVLAAELNGELRVDFIDPEEVVESGELVLTSGLGGSYPPDIPVGEVLSLRARDYELFQQAVIEPVVDFNDLRILLVITSFRPLPVISSSP